MVGRRQLARSGGPAKCRSSSSPQMSMLSIWVAYQAVTTLSSIDQTWMRLRDNRPATHTVVNRKQLPSSHLPYVFASTTKRLSCDLSAVRRS